MLKLKFEISKNVWKNLKRVEKKFWKEFEKSGKGLKNFEKILLCFRLRRFARISEFWQNFAAKQNYKQNFDCKTSRDVDNDCSAIIVCLHRVLEFCLWDFCHCCGT